jgi:hypothetical protein
VTALEWLNQNQGVVQAVLTLLLVLVSFQLWWLERDRSRANFQLRHAHSRDVYEPLVRQSKVWFALANLGGVASPPDPARCFVLIERGKRLGGLVKKWEKVGLEIYTQHHYLQIESAHKGWKDSMWENIGEKDKDPTLAPSAINAYVARFSWEKPDSMYTPAWLCIAPIKGRRRWKEFQAG